MSDRRAVRPQPRLKPYVMRLYLLALVVFVANKFWLRPVVLAHDGLDALKVVTLSLPNTLEAIFGVMLVAIWLLLARGYFSPRFDRLSDPLLYGLALLLASIYVLTQEFKLHHLGGRNTYDPNDVVASIIGLLATYGAAARWGVLDFHEAPESSG